VRYFKCPPLGALGSEARTQGPWHPGRATMLMILSCGLAGIKGPFEVFNFFFRLLGPMTPNLNSVAGGSLTRKTPGRVRRVAFQARLLAGCRNQRGACSDILSAQGRVAVRLLVGGQWKDSVWAGTLRLAYGKPELSEEKLYLSLWPLSSQVFVTCAISNVHPSAHSALRRGLRGPFATCSSDTAMAWTRQPK
jgi:hypothetical protein